MQVEIDFDVYKALTARREHEMHTYNDVLRNLLGLESIQEPEEAESPLQAASDSIARRLGMFGFYSRGIHLPNGTMLRARYKQREHKARIVNDKWFDELEREHSSPSAAASAITGTNVNGLRFWEAKRPSDTAWLRLELLRNQ